MSSKHASPVDADEWAAQERGRHAAGSAGSGPVDARDQVYRRIADAVRSQPQAGPPPGFAASVAAHALREDRRLERSLSRILRGVFTLAAASVIAAYALQWWPSLQQALGPDALRWLLLGSACMATSWIVRRMLTLPARADPGRRTGVARS